MTAARHQSVVRFTARCTISTICKWLSGVWSFGAVYTECMNETELTTLRIVLGEYAGETMNLRLRNKALQIELEQSRSKVTELEGRVQALSPPPEPSER